MRLPPHGAAKFYTGGIALCPEEELFSELTFLAYYLHWPPGELLALPHAVRRRFCGEVSALHRRETPGSNPFAL